MALIDDTQPRIVAYTYIVLFIRAELLVGPRVVSSTCFKPTLPIIVIVCIELTCRRYKYLIKIQLGTDLRQVDNT